MTKGLHHRNLWLARIGVPFGIIFMIGCYLMYIGSLDAGWVVCYTVATFCTVISTKLYIREELHRIARLQSAIKMHKAGDQWLTIGSALALWLIVTIVLNLMAVINGQPERIVLLTIMAVAICTMLVMIRFARKSNDTFFTKQELDAEVTIQKENQQRQL